MLKKKQTILFCFVLGTLGSLNAQDIITKINGDEIQTKVTEIGVSEVKYRRFDNTSGPVYTVQKSDVFMIVYEDGSKDVFGKQPSKPQPVLQVTAPASAPASASIPVTAPAPAYQSQTPAATQTTPLAYAKRGDIVEINGHKAIVFQTYGHGHGKAMYVKALRGEKNAWCKTDAIKRLKTSDKENGRANTEAVFRFVEENGLNIADFPAAAWCKSLGNGWYIPSLKELETFINWWLGNEVELNWDDESDDEAQSPMLSETPFAKQINRQLLDAGGIPFLNGAFTSTENEKGRLSVFWYNERKKFWQFGTLSKTNIGTMYLGRAFFEY